MHPSSRSVCVIGAGLAGLGSIQSCLDEGLDPTCYEMRDDVGGLWRYTDEDIDGRGCVMKSTIINTSKEMSSISYTTFPEHFPNYMHNQELLKALSDFVDQFQLRKYVLFHHKVLSVVPSKDYDVTGRWTVRLLNVQSSQEKVEEFGAVMVCTGHHAFPMMPPPFPGQDKFKGRILHSHSFKTNAGFEGRSVTVVGAGNSALDVAVDVSQVSNKAYLSTRRGLWLTPRVGPWGIPSDVFLLSRFFNTMFNHLPWSVTNTFTEAFVNTRMDHEAYGLKPRHRYLAQHPTLNDTLPTQILSGRIIVKGNIKEFTEQGVVFEGEEAATPVDDVVMCTGYKICFPFIDRNIAKFEDNKVEFYKFVFPPDLRHPTLAFIGLFQPTGPGIPAGEIQCRWVTRVLNGKSQLPSREAMWKDIREFNKKTREYFGDSPCHTINVYYINYLDEIATKIGCKPNLLRMLFTDPKLFFHCYFGPCLPYQYRLEGPGAWKGARKAILTYKKRLYAPLKSKRLQKTSRHYLNAIHVAFITFLLAMVGTIAFVDIF